MTFAQSLTPLLPVIIAAGPFLAAAEPEPLKCGQSENGPLIAIDGEIVDMKMDDLDRDRLRYVEIVCLDPADSTFSKRPGIPVISVWTVDGPVARFEPLLQEVLEIQRDHHAMTGRYLEAIDIATLETLADDLGKAHAERVDFTMEVTGGGWIATVTVPRFLGVGVVCDGSGPSPHASITIGQPTISRRDLVEQAGVSGGDS